MSNINNMDKNVQDSSEGNYRVAKSRLKNEKRYFAKIVFLFQGAVILYSLAGAIGKCASREAAFSARFLLLFIVEITVLVIYAFIWQQLIKRADLSVAYANRATTIFWSGLWATVFFHERLTIKNIMGILIIFIGVWVVNNDD